MAEYEIAAGDRTEHELRERNRRTYELVRRLSSHGDVYLAAEEIVALQDRVRALEEEYQTKCPVCCWHGQHMPGCKRRV